MQYTSLVHVLRGLQRVVLPLPYLRLQRYTLGLCYSSPLRCCMQQALGYDMIMIRHIGSLDRHRHDLVFVLMLCQCGRSALALGNRQVTVSVRSG